MVDKLFVATKALVCYDNKILLLKESTQYADGTNASRYDVPGGRLTPGERFDESLLREVQEETGLDVTIKRPFHMDEWRPQVRDEQWQVVATFFVCEAKTDTVTLSKDHEEYAWVTPQEALTMDIIPNLRAMIQAYQSLEETQ